MQMQTSPHRDYLLQMHLTQHPHPESWAEEDCPRCAVFGVVRKRWWDYIVLHLLGLLFIRPLSCVPDFYSQNDNLLLLYIVFPRTTGYIPR